MSVRFEHQALAQRIVFASGESAERVADEVSRLGGTRVMAIASADDQAVSEKILAQLSPVASFSEVVMHVPVEVATRARSVASAHDVDLVVSVGGGSTTGLAKAVALTTGLPILAVPTTYAGSEATNVWGLTDSGRKTTGADDRVLPRTVVYDASLTLSLPVAMSVASGLNAMAHCVDSMWAPRTDPINQTFALAAVRALRLGLSVVADDPTDLDGREQLLYGAYLAAVAFSAAGSGLHHKICHVLGGLYNLPHAQTHAVVLPYVLAFNAPAVPDTEQRLAQAFGAGSALAGLQQLRHDVGAPTSLADHGLTEDDLPAAVAAILPVVPESNPRPVGEADLQQLLSAALHGREPS